MAEPAAPFDCPCGTGAAYAACCGRWHAGEPAPDALALMRSRYSAYVLGLPGYLRDTWHPSTRPPALQLDDPDGLRVVWLGLQVKSHRSAGDQAQVEFVARYRAGGASAVRMAERSRFVREGGRWYYLDGEVG